MQELPWVFHSQWPSGSSVPNRRICLETLIFNPTSVKGRDGMSGLSGELNTAAMADAERKGKRYWIDEISFLEARLNGSQGDIDQDDRAACEEALKAAQTRLAECSD